MNNKVKEETDNRHLNKQVQEYTNKLTQLNKDI